MKYIKGFFHHFYKYFVLASAFFFFLLAIPGVPAFERQVFGAVGLLLFLGPLFLAFVGLFLVLADRGFTSALEAGKPIPTPPEIAWGLRQEWGRWPTDVEVQVVQQALINRRNEHLVAAGLSFGAIYLAAHGR